MDLAHVPKNIINFFRNMNWARIRDNMRKFLNKILYFLIVVVILQSIGVIIPIVVDFFKHEGFSSLSTNIVSYNILTYSASIFLASLVKRVLVFVDDEKYIHKKLEVLILIVGTIIQSGLIFYALNLLLFCGHPVKLYLAAPHLISTYS